MAAPEGQKATKDMIKKEKDLMEKVDPSNLEEVANPSRSQIPMQYPCKNLDQQITL